MDPALPRGELRVDATGVGTAVAFSHEAHCPEDNPVWCAENTLEPYVHHQSLTWGRLEPALEVGLGGGFQLGVAVPLDLRVLRVDYSTLDGEPYVPPEPLQIHHRDETLAGFADGRLLLRWYKGGFGLGVGSSLPLGRTEEDPYALTEQGREHQHMQLGSGTFDPLLTLEYSRLGPMWGLTAVGSARLGLYENSKGYRPPSSFSAVLLPSYALGSDLRFALGPGFELESPAYWNGVSAETSGRSAVFVDLSLYGRVGPTLSPWGSLRVTAVQWSFDEEAIVQRAVLSAGVAWRPKGSE